MDAARRTGPALEAMYRFVLWLVPTVERFPRSQKFLLGDRLQATALDVLERLIDATYTRARGPHLAAANLGIEKLRYLCRLAKDLAALGRAAQRARGARAGRDGPAHRGLAEGSRRTMPRVRDGLFDGVASFEALGAAALRAVAGKRRTPVPAAFLANLETEVLRLGARAAGG